MWRSLVTFKLLRTTAKRSIKLHMKDTWKKLWSETKVGRRLRELVDKPHKDNI